MKPKSHRLQYQERLGDIPLTKLLNYPGHMPVCEEHFSGKKKKKKYQYYYFGAKGVISSIQSKNEQSSKIAHTQIQNLL